MVRIVDNPRAHTHFTQTPFLPARATPTAHRHFIDHFLTTFFYQDTWTDDWAPPAGIRAFTAALFAAAGAAADRRAAQNIIFLTSVYGLGPNQYRLDQHRFDQYRLTYFV